MHTLSDRVRTATIGLLLAALAWSAPTAAQTDVTVITQVTGSLDTSLYTLADHMQVTVLAGGPDSVNDIVFTMRLRGDNGVEIRSPENFHPSEPFPLSVRPGLPLVLTGLDLADYFDPGQLLFHGMSRDDYYEQGLPPGDYRLCFQAVCPQWLCPDGEVALSPEPPVGCSNTFTVQAFEPPFLTNPPCNAEIAAGAVQSLVFAWTPSPGAPPIGTFYELEVVEMIEPGLSPDEAMDTATTPPFFRREVQGTSFFYGPGEPLLEPGRSYAWRVTVSSPELRLPFTNGGRSRACAFTLGEDETSLIPIDVLPAQPGPGVTATPDTYPLAPWSTVRGKLRYTFKTLGDVDTSGPSGSIGQIGQSGQTGPITQADPILTQLHDPNGPWYNDGAIHADSARPLANMTVSLAVTYRLLDGAVGGSGTESEIVLHRADLIEDGYNPLQIDTLFPDMDRVLATTTTGSDGAFAFQFVQTPELGLAATDLQAFIGNTHLGNGQVVTSITAAKVTRTLRLVVESHYYCSPETDILARPWVDTDVGTLTSYVRSYHLLLTAKPNTSRGNQAAVGAIPGAKVYILRKTAPNAEIPGDEGDPSGHGTLNLPQGQFRIVDRGETDDLGEVEFTRLVHPWSAEDAYYFYTLTPDTKGNYVYKPKLGHHQYPVIVHRYPESNGDLDLERIFRVKTYLEADHPRVFGRVMDKANTNTPIPDAMLVLTSHYASDGPGSLANLWPYLFDWSDDQGYFAFDGLEVQEQGDQLVGPDRWLGASKPGYAPWEKHLGILAWGRQMDLTSEVKLQPEGRVGGSVVDAETGAPVAADVYFDAGISTQTAWFFGAQAFMLAAPSGDDQEITIVPHDTDYEPKTFTRDIPKSDDIIYLGEFGVTRRRHRLKVQVLCGLPNSGLMMMMTPQLQPMIGATVTILGHTATTDPHGIATLVFDNGAATFQARVAPPAGADYVTLNTTLASQPTTYFMERQVVLPPAARISGTVTVGGAATVEGARVFVDAGSGPGVVPIETVTDAEGRYTLRGIPLSPATVAVHAVRSSQTTTYVGDTKSIQVPTTAEVDLDLTIYDGMDITRLLGFPLEITHLVETGGGAVRIDGAFRDLPSAAGFVPADFQTVLPFHDVALRPGSATNAAGAPYAVPQTAPVPTETPALDLHLFDAFNATALPVQTGGLLTVERVSDTAGRIRARVRIDPNSFSFSSNTLDMGAGPTLAGPGGAVTVFASGADADPVDRYDLAGQSGSCAYSLYGFAATAPQTQAYVRGDTIALYTTLHADVGKSGPLPVDIATGWVRVHAASVDPIAGAGPLSIALEQWQVVGSGWELGAGTNGVVCAAGAVNTGAITVPVQGLHVKPDDLVIDAVDLQDLTLSGVAPLTILTHNAGFGYDPQVGEDQQGHWKLSLLPDGTTPAARLTGLPGMAPTAAFTFQSIDLLSNGEQQLGFGADAPDVVFYDVFRFTPGNLVSYDDFFEIAGTVDLGVPRLAASYQAILAFTGEDGGDIELRLTPIPFAFDAPGQIEYTAIQTMGAQTLDVDGYTASCRLRDQEGLVLTTRLHRTPQATWIEVDPLGQSLRIGESTTSLSAITGEMRVQPATQDWNKFVFAGDMTGVTGMEGDLRKTFTIHGDITADNQTISVEKIPTGFGNIGLTFDYANARMTGELEIDQSFSGTQVRGLANLLVDGDGWYIVSGGDITLPGFGNLQAGLLIGDYAVMPTDVATKLMSFAYDQHVPPAFQHGISGFFFTGRKNIPQLSIPDEDFDLVVVRAYFGGETGLDARVWASFGDPDPELGIGAMGFVTAHYLMSSIFCTSISGGAAVEMGQQGTLDTAGNFELRGCGSVTVYGSVEQCVPTPTWDGGLECELCTGVSVEKSLSLEMSMGTSGVDASLHLGTCSGNQPDLSSNW